MDTLRRELQAEGAPTSITSVKPATINTLLFEVSLNKMDVKPKAPPPCYEPAVVADCVLCTAENPVRGLSSGGVGKMMATTRMLAPKLMDAAMERFGIDAGRTDIPEPGGAPCNLFAPNAGADKVERYYGPRAQRFSLCTRLETRPTAKALAAAGGVLAGTLLLARGNGAAGRGRRCGARLSPRKIGFPDAQALGKSRRPAP